MANRQLIAGVGSSTQSVKAVVRDHTGALVREGRTAHPGGIELDPSCRCRWISWS